MNEIIETLIVSLTFIIVCVIIAEVEEKIINKE